MLFEAKLYLSSYTNNTGVSIKNIKKCMNNKTVLTLVLKILTAMSILNKWVHNNTDQ